MGKQRFITDEEREKCRKVAEVFAELEDENIIIVEVGIYGFIKLEYYAKAYRFVDVITFTDSQILFEDLWYEWLYAQVVSFAKGTSLMKLDIEDIFKCMPKEKQKELMEKKKYFAEKTGIKELLLVNEK